MYPLRSVFRIRKQTRDEPEAISRLLLQASAVEEHELSDSLPEEGQTPMGTALLDKLQSLN
jgi:hypothetical protein